MDNDESKPKFNFIALASGLIPSYAYVILVYFYREGTDAHLVPLLYAIGFMVFIVPIFMLFWYPVASLALDFTKTRASDLEHAGLLMLINYGLLFAGCTTGLS